MVGGAGGGGADEAELAVNPKTKILQLVRKVVMKKVMMKKSMVMKSMMMLNKLGSITCPPIPSPLGIVFCLRLKYW